MSEPLPEDCRFLVQTEGHYRMSWYTDDGITKEIDHILVNTRWKSLANCRVFRELEFESD